MLKAWQTITNSAHYYKFHIFYTFDNLEAKNTLYYSYFKKICWVKKSYQNKKILESCV